MLLISKICDQIISHFHVALTQVLITEGNQERMKFCRMLSFITFIEYKVGDFNVKMMTIISNRIKPSLYNLRAATSWLCILKNLA